MNNENESFSNRLGRSRMASPVLYLLAITGFFFTFFNLRCGTAELARVSGMAMATGGKCEIKSNFLSEWTDPDTKEDSTRINDIQKGFFGKRDSSSRLPVNYWALGALVAAILALLMSLFHTLKGYMIQLGLAASSILLLLLMLFTRQQYALRIMKLDTVMARNRGGIFGETVLNLQMAWAYWFSLFTLIFALLAGMLRQRMLKLEMENAATLELFNPGNEDENSQSPG